MTEEPYRWLEAVGNRREYVREQLKGGSPVIAASLTEGILLAGVSAGPGKVFELHDRQAMAGLGHPADLERIRQSAIDAAHLEAFTRAPEDVSLRRLVGFGLSAQLKQNFEQLFTAPILGEFVFAELGATPSADLLVRLRFDGSFQIQSGGVMVVAADPDAESPATEWLNRELPAVNDQPTAIRRIMEAWWIMMANRRFDDSIPSASERESGWRAAVEGQQIELGWLSRLSKRAARYEILNPRAVLEAKT